MIATQQILKDRVQHLKNSYKLNWVKNLFLPCDLNFVPFTLSPDRLFYSQRGVLNQGISHSGKIFSISRNTTETPQEELGSIVTPNHFPICHLGKNNQILYPAGTHQEKMELKTLDLKKGEVDSFGKISRKWIYPLCIRFLPPHVFVADYFSHELVKFSVEGTCLKTIETSNGFEYPRIIAPYDQDNLLVVFSQERGKKSRPEFSKKSDFS